LSNAAVRRSGERCGEERTGIIGQEIPALSNATETTQTLHYIPEYRVLIKYSTFSLKYSGGVKRGDCGPNGPATFEIG
jgi:hypothetical protein